MTLFGVAALVSVIAMILVLCALGWLLYSICTDMFSLALVVPVSANEE